MFSPMYWQLLTKYCQNHRGGGPLWKLISTYWMEAKRGFLAKLLSQKKQLFYFITEGRCVNRGDRRAVSLQVEPNGLL